MIKIINELLEKCDRLEKENEKLRKQEEEYFESVNILNMITENASDLIAILDLRGNRLYNSESYNSIFGDKNKLFGTNSFREIHPNDKEKIKKIFYGTVSTGVGQRSEFRFLLPDGSVRYIESIGDLIRNKYGKPEKVIVVSRDVTERKKTEQKIIEQERKYRNLLESMRDSIFVINKKMEIEYINRQLEETKGISRENILGKHQNVLFSVDSPEYKKFTKEIEEAFNKGSENKFLSKSFLVDNEEWKDTRIFPVVNDEGSVEYVIGIARNISSLINDENLLKERKNKFKDLVEKNNGIIYCLNEFGIFDYVSPSVFNMLGYSHTEITGMPINDLIHPDDLEKLATILSAIRNGKEDVFCGRILNKSKEYVDVELSGKFSDNDNSGVIYGIISNVSAQKEYANLIKNYCNELEEINKNKDKFFSILAHDLKNPFNSILGFSEYLAKYADELTYDQIREYSLNMYQASEKVYQLVENLLSWSRLQSGKIEFVKTKLNLKKLIDQTVHLFLIVANSKKIKMVNKIKDDIYCKADENMISTVLRNLIANALKFTGNNGTVVFSSEMENSKILISVTDSGVGISSAKIKYLFSTTRLISSDGTNKEKGTGLGLLICKEFIERNGGEIWVASIEGKGSKFTFSLPVNN
ncbi:MAG: PAS domain-containing sensor histidine kinase [Ignavibacteria bacterium]